MIEGFQPRILDPKPKSTRKVYTYYEDRVKILDDIARNIFMTEVNKRRFRHIYIEHAYTRK